MSSSIEITPELLAGFLDEAPEYLEMLDAGLMEFESKASAGGVLALDTPEDQEQMNVMFRAAHSLKGLAAAFGFDKIKELTHRMETLFDQVRMGKRDLTTDSFETLFQVFDRLKALVQELTGESGEVVEIDDVLAALDAVLASDSKSESAAPSADDAVAADDTSQVSNTEPDPAEDATPAVASATPAATTDPSSPRPHSEVLDDPELASLFVEATTEAIDELNQGLLGLEENPTDVELMNVVFRCAHNIKGASGAAGLTGMNRTTHDMETIFDLLRNGRLDLEESLMNAIFEVVDRLRVTIDAIREGHFEDVPLEEMQAKFAPWSDHTGADAALDDSTASDSLAVEDSNPETVEQRSGLESDYFQIEVTFPDGFEEAAIQAYLIYNRLGDAGEVIASDPDLDAVSGDTPLTKLRFTLEADCTAADIERAVSSYEVESVKVTGGPPADDDDVPETKVEPAQAAPPVTQAPGTGNADAAAGEAPVVTQPVPTATKPVAAPPKAKAAAGKPEQKPVKTAETLRVDQDRLDELMNLGGELVINRARFTQVHGRFRELFNGKNLGFLVDDISEHLQKLSEEVSEDGEGAPPSPNVADLVSHVSHLSQSFVAVRGVLERVHELRTAMFDFDEALHGLTRVSGAIQTGIMGTRMVPVGPLFSRFRRVVRDISKSNGKQVDLILRGEATELDKRMIDELGDPLTHMVRNSVDHGIEMPDVRQAAGKNPAGTVILEASHRGNSICIEVRDDGAGINVDRIKEKIVEKEMATPEQVETMSDRELMQYILKPGFSTAPVVTDLSGRGMGMDIVINKIEKLSGSIEIDSIAGEGSTITIKLPLTLAILTSMVARIGDGIYAIPLETVAEIITCKQADVQWIQRRPVVRVRERIVPLAFFEDIFGTEDAALQSRSKGSDELTLMIVGYESDKMGLVVDELLGQEDVVIKSLSENFRNVRGVAGASIRGDGAVSLILDIGTMMDMAQKLAVSASDEPKLSEPVGV